jgi:hypothetical protein
MIYIVIAFHEESTPLVDTRKNVSRSFQTYNPQELAKAIVPNIDKGDVQHYMSRVAKHFTSYSFGIFKVTTCRKL